MCPERVNNKDTIGWNKRRKTKIFCNIFNMQLD